MDIIWHGHSCFTLKGSEATVVTDPYSGLGLDLPKLKGQIVTLGQQAVGEFEGVASVESASKVLDWPGEFEIAGVAIEALTSGQAEDDVRIFLFNLDGLRMAHLSGLSHEISDELLEHIGDVDILMIPVGGGPVLDAKTAQKLVESIEPRIVVPMYFLTEGSKLNLQNASEFLKIMGKSNLEAQEKFSIKGRSGLPEEHMEVVLLTPVLK